MSGEKQINLDRCLLINNIRRRAVTLAFEKDLGRRAFILISPFPFMVIGKIVELTCDYVFIDVETTHISELEGETIRIHLDDIDVFFIEEPGLPRIPLVSNIHNPCEI